MTAQDAIRWVDEKKHNVYPAEDKLVWLGQVEQMAGELAERYGAAAHRGAVEMTTVLTVPEPWDQMYLRWLETQIDYANQEYLQYNNGMALFNTLWEGYANRYCRTHLRSAGVYRVM